MRRLFAPVHARCLTPGAVVAVRSVGFMGSGRKSVERSPAASTAKTEDTKPTAGFGPSRSAAKDAAGAIRRLAGDVQKTATVVADANIHKTPHRPREALATRCDGSKVHTERCVMGWNPDDIYAVVADVGKYTEFLPWCVASNVHHSDHADPMLATKMDATLSVGFSFFREKYTSDVVLVPGQSIHARLQGDSTLLKELRCDWEFQPHTIEQNPSAPASQVCFAVSFAFRNPLHTNLTSMVMSNVVMVMTSSFEDRIKALHGAPSIARYNLPALEGTPAATSTVADVAGNAAEKAGKVRTSSWMPNLTS